MLSEAADTIHAGAGTDTLILTGGEQVYAGTGSLAVYGRGISTGATVFGAAGTTTLNGDTGNILYQGGASANTLSAEVMEEFDKVLSGLAASGAG